MGTEAALVSPRMRIHADSIRKADRERDAMTVTDSRELPGRRGRGFRRRFVVLAAALGLAALAAAPAVAGAWGAPGSVSPVVRACDPPDQDGPDGPVRPPKVPEHPIERPKKPHLC